MTGNGPPPSPLLPPGDDGHDRARTRTRLIDVAARTLVRNGSTLTTMSDVAAAAGTDLATLETHFPTRGDLVFAVYQAVSASSQHLWTALDATLLDRRRTGLTGWLGDAMDWWAENAAVLRVIRESAVMDTDVGSRIRDDFVGMVRQLTAFLASVPEGQRAEAKLTVQMLILQLDQVCFEWLAYRPGTVDRESVLHRLADIWTRSLSPW